ncbi:hypothetical protein FOA52_003946 [Chlamydomonas sp. UWO 241]|nr:hypothetical protein FOA52_003946 [Chlamydomonas sp. UWO 241]
MVSVSASIKLLTRTELMRLVKAAQREKMAGPDGTWSQYIAAKVPKLKSNDPDKHARDTLLGFVEGLAGQEEADGSEASGSEPDDSDDEEEPSAKKAKPGGVAGAKPLKGRKSRRPITRMARWVLWLRASSRTKPGAAAAAAGCGRHQQQT